jgi:hypothetical protein
MTSPCLFATHSDRLFGGSWSFVLPGLDYLYFPVAIITLHDTAVVRSEFILHARRHELIALALLAFASIAAAQEVTVTMQFTAANFAGAAYILGQPPGLAPTDPVSGTIVWQAASANAPIQSFDSINLTIAGHSYSAGEITYQDRSDIDGTYLIGFPVLANSANNFWMMWYPNSMTPYQFAYTAANTNGEWSTYTFTDFTITYITDPPTALSIKIIGPNVSLAFPTVSNQTYDIQSTANLISTPWSTIVSNLPGTGAIATNIDVGAATMRQKFYRVGVQQ